MSRRPRQPRAFTLLELLVATAMTAVLAGSLYATLHIAFQAQRTAAHAVENVRRAELAAELIRRDLESAIVPRGILAGVFYGEDGVTASGRAADAVALHCTADGGQETEGVGDVRMVEFACETAEDGRGLVLLRRVTLNLLSTNVQEPVEEVICRDVRSFELVYFDGTDWVDSWDSAAQDNALPLAVGVTIELISEDEADADAAGYWISRVFRLPCSSLTTGLEVEMTP